MPRINVRALAEMLQLPAYEQLRILTAQKYPKQQPQIFRTPYYQPALAGIRQFYRANNEPATLARVRQAAQELSLDARRSNNLRVLDAFEASSQYSRRLTPIPSPRLAVTIGTVDLRLSPDLRARGALASVIIYYNCRNAPLDPRVAKNTLEIAHWVLEQSGQPLPIRDIEYIDLHSGHVYRLNRRLGSVIRQMRNNIRVIEALWPTI